MNDLELDSISKKSDGSYRAMRMDSSNHSRMNDSYDIDLGVSMNKDGPLLEGYEKEIVVVNTQDAPVGKGNKPKKEPKKEHKDKDHIEDQKAEWKDIAPSYTVIDHEKDKGCTKYLYPKHYIKYFDVSTSDVTKRVLRSLFPIMPGSIFDPYNKLDMYGPLWTMI